MRSIVLLVGGIGCAMLCGCGLLDLGSAQEEGEAAPVDPPAAKVAVAKPIQRKPHQAANAPAKPPANKPDAAIGGDDADEADEADGADEADDEPAKSRRRIADDDGDENDDAPAERKKERDLGADLFVKRLVIAKGVKGREPVGAAKTFSKSDKVYAFVEVGNRDQVPSEVYVSFYEKKTGKGQRVPLKIGAGSRWRTWVYTRNAKTPGTWMAVVKNAKGKTLASQSFEISGKKSTADKSEEKKAEKKKGDEKASKTKADEKKADEKKADEKKADEKKADEKKAGATPKKTSDEKKAEKKAAKGAPKKGNDKAEPTKTDAKPKKAAKKPTEK